MGVRRRIARTSQQIMESDITVAIKKAKVKFRTEGLFYILKYNDTYFASGYVDNDGSYFQELRFDDDRKKWVCFK